MANATLGAINSKAELLTLTETVAADYNGNFSEVSTQCRRSGGFLMTGSQSQTIAAAGSPTDVNITLKRTVAKVAVQTKLASALAASWLQWLDEEGRGEGFSLQKGGVASE